MKLCESEQLTHGLPTTLILHFFRQVLFPTTLHMRFFRKVSFYSQWIILSVWSQNESTSEWLKGKKIKLFLLCDWICIEQNLIIPLALLISRIHLIKNLSVFLFNSLRYLFASCCKRAKSGSPCSKLQSLPVENRFWHNRQDQFSPNELVYYSSKSAFAHPNR